MSKRKLSALEYPSSDPTNTKDETEFRKAIAWLEENKIKKYKPEGHQNICNIESSEWRKSFDKYKQDVACPVTSNVPSEELVWFIKYATKQEYANKEDAYGKHCVKTLQSPKTPNVVAVNPLDHLDFTSKEFENGIAKIMLTLKVSPHPDLLLVLRALSKVVCNRLNQKALANPNDFIIKGTPFPFQDAVLGFDLGDVLLNKAAKILRLLYIHDLRNLQTKSNELVVAVQSITANPKTDTKLGKVGI